LAMRRQWRAVSRRAELSAEDQAPEDHPLHRRTQDYLAIRARPKRLRFLLLNTVAKVVRHARETLLRCTKAIARALAGPPRTRFALKRPVLAGV
jgi:hypothetical protein